MTRQGIRDPPDVLYLHATVVRTHPVKEYL